MLEHGSHFGRFSAFEVLEETSSGTLLADGINKRLFYMNVGRGPFTNAATKFHAYHLSNQRKNRNGMRPVYSLATTLLLFNARGHRDHQGHRVCIQRPQCVLDRALFDLPVPLVLDLCDAHVVVAPGGVDQNLGLDSLLGAEALDPRMAEGG